MTLVLGVDGCPGGWCTVALDIDACTIVDARVHRSFQSVLDSPAAVICVDIPIGLLDVPGKRDCDVEARRMLERGWPRVFPPPSRAVLADTGLTGFFRGEPFALGETRRLHRRACDINRAAVGLMLNLQSFYIAPKIYSVDSLVTPELQKRIREVHPEVCFWALNGGRPLKSNKKTPAGREDRWQLLREALRDLDEVPALPGRVGGSCRIEDYIDAIVCAWTAACVVRGQARRIPAAPEVDERGLRMEMWFPPSPPRGRRGPAARRRSRRGR